MNGTDLAAIKIERRVLAAAVFAGEHLDYTHTRQLAANSTRAMTSAVGFTQWIVESFQLEIVAVEEPPAERSSRRQELTDAVIESLRREGIAVWRVSKHELLASFGQPPLKTRKQLRAIIRGFWPVLPAERGNGTTLDAAALGIYVQIQRELDK